GKTSIARPSGFTVVPRKPTTRTSMLCGQKWKTAHASKRSGARTRKLQGSEASRPAGWRGRGRGRVRGGVGPFPADAAEGGGAEELTRARLTAQPARRRAAERTSRPCADRPHPRWTG